MMNLATVKCSLRALSVQAIAFSEPALQAAWTRLKRVCSWVVACRETDCRRGSASEAAVRHLIVSPNHRHLRPMVGKIEEPTCGPNGDRVGCVEAEEPNSGFDIML